MESTVTTAPVKKKLSAFKKVVLFILALIALSFLLQLGGIKVVNKTEADTMIERPHG